MKGRKPLFFWRVLVRAGLFWYSVFVHGAHRSVDMACLFAVSVFDEKMGEFQAPVFVTHIGVGVRAFGDECKRKDSAFAAHPEDYSLWCLGSFDSSKGELVVSAPERLVRAVNFVEV